MTGDLKITYRSVYYIQQELKEMPGFNTEITHKGTSFHVQTQDKGMSAQYVESIIYKSGKVLASRRTFYTSFLGSSNIQGKIREIIKEQHDTILKEIREGKFDHI